MVRPARLERATYGLEGRCSIQLSYERVKKVSVASNVSKRGETIAFAVTIVKACGILCRYSCVYAKSLSLIQTS